MPAFSDDTTWVHLGDKKLYMHIPLVYELATIHYYSVNTFSYVSLPLSTFEKQLIAYRLVYIANTDVEYIASSIGDSTGDFRRNMVQLTLTVEGQKFLQKVPLVPLVAELSYNRLLPERPDRFYPYGEPVYSKLNDSIYAVAASYMEDLSISELPQFLSHEIDTIREKAHELLTPDESDEPAAVLRSIKTFYKLQ